MMPPSSEPRRAPSPFTGVRPVLHTPFGNGGEVLYDELAALAGVMVDGGHPGVVTLGLASETWTLTERERQAVLETVAEAVAGRAQLCVGVDGPTAQAVLRARQAAAAGAASVMVLPPPAPARDPRDIRRHFLAVADAAAVPVLVQDSPQVSGATLPADLLVGMRDAHPLVGSVKLEAPDAGRLTSTLVAEGLEVVAGWGGLHYVESTRRGAIGVFPGCDLAAALQDVHRHAAREEWGAAVAAYTPLLPLLALETRSLELLLLGAKHVLRRAGVFSSDMIRASGRTLDDTEAAEMDRLLMDLSSAGVPGPWNSWPLATTYA